MFTLICQNCGKEFQKNRRDVKSCSPECAKALNHRTQIKWETRSCVICGKEFRCKPHQGKQTCSKDCKNILISQTEKGKKCSDLVRQKMRENNPSSRPDVQAKIRETRKKNGTLHTWMGVRGGNGHFTKPQIALKELLGTEWILEYAIPTHCPQSAHLYPTNYKVDLGLPTLKLAIEVDGADHNTKSQRLLDEKKTKCLNNLGWTVLRFTNQEIMTDSLSVISVIRSYEKKLLKCTTLK